MITTLWISHNSRMLTSEKNIYFFTWYKMKDNIRAKPKPQPGRNQPTKRVNGQKNRTLEKTQGKKNKKDKLF